jgi:hypothetical protein
VMMKIWQAIYSQWWQTPPADPCDSWKCMADDWVVEWEVEGENWGATRV